MANENDLSAEQTDKLLQFQDLTGIEDMAQCRQILTTHNWDLEVAVHHRLSEEDGDPSPFEQEAPEPRTPTIDVNPIDQRVYTALAPRRHYPIYQWPFLIVWFPFRYLYKSLFNIFQYTYRLVFPDPRTRVTNPLGDVVSFVSNFESKYGNLHPTFYNGTYSQALNEAKNDLRFLLVYLHSEQHQETARFCRLTLCHEEIITYMDSHVILWACDTSTPEGYRVAQIIRDNTYPLLALIVLREHKMTVVARIEGAIDPDELLRRLQRSICDNEASLVAARADREERSFNRTLREDQDQAYQQSLKADQEKERKKREEEEEKERELQREEDERLDEIRKIEELENRKTKLRDSLPDEPLPGDPDVVKLLLKLPNGTRLERSFRKSESLKYLYNYVLVHEASPDDFQIVTNFPRKVLPCQPPEDNGQDPPTFEEVGLGKSEMLFVHDNEA